jgi:hypothetical protein
VGLVVLFVRTIIIVMLFCTHSLKFVVLRCVFNMVCVHIVDEITYYYVHILLWVTNAVVYD